MPAVIWTAGNCSLLTAVKSYILYKGNKRTEL